MLKTKTKSRFGLSMSIFGPMLKLDRKYPKKLNLLRTTFRYWKRWTFVFLINCNWKWVKPTFRSSSVIFSALRAFRHSTLCDPCLRKNSIESKPRPSEETKMAELIRLRLQRSAITVDGSSGCQPWWTCCKYTHTKIHYCDAKNTWCVVRLHVLTFNRYY